MMCNPGFDYPKYVEIGEIPGGVRILVIDEEGEKHTLYINTGQHAGYAGKSAITESEQEFWAQRRREKLDEITRLGEEMEGGYR